MKAWLGELAAKEFSDTSRDRIVSFCRNYWRYLQHIDAVPSDSDPFAKLGISRRRNGGGGKRASSWEPFKAADVAALWKAARAAGDTQLADLVLVGAYSGARIEELCSLKVSGINASTFKIADAKTAAGVREVPIHSRIKPTITRASRRTRMTPTSSAASRRTSTETEATRLANASAA